MMIKKIVLPLLFLPMTLSAQKNVMTPETLWSLGRVSPVTMSPDNGTLLYRVTTYDVATENSTGNYFYLDLMTNGAKPAQMIGLNERGFVQWDKNGLYATNEDELQISKDNGITWKKIAGGLKDAQNLKVSPDGKWLAYSKEVLVEKVKGDAIYGDLPKTTAQVYTSLNYRHWDYWFDGKVNHVFVQSINNPRTPVKDIMESEPYDCPLRPFGGGEDFMFTPDSRGIVYVSKKKTGTQYAVSTNTDIYHYDIGDAKTKNLSEGMMGYDLSPEFNHDGSKLAWLSMRRDGYEADKNDIIVMEWPSGRKVNVTEGWDETVDGSYLWGDDNETIFYTASVKGTQQLFSVSAKAEPGDVTTKQITVGNFNVTDLISQTGQTVIASRMDFNHATEIYQITLNNGQMWPLTHVNDQLYKNIEMSKSELRMVKTKDGHDMGVWVIYPPHFDPNKKYPTLLYCQGGPQGALSQFYSYRWNFQLMAANGYIIVAPNRRGMPGWGVKWNEVISKDWGGKPMQDYLDAIDALAKEPFVDKNHLGCVGASYGGYSTYMLAGIHENRFKTFIAHDGLFDMRSWYGTTEEIWFANWDLGGNYWDKPTPDGYTKFNPSEYVKNWTSPIMIIQGGIDFRVPIEQGLQAYQAAQLRGIKSKLLYFPNENHWVLHPQNSILWQREFFKWLKETI